MASMILLLLLISQARTIKNNWTRAQAYEQEWVADSLLYGYGYSFDPATAWLGPYGNGTTYSHTAWVEPIYTFLIAGVLKAFGEYGRLVLTLLNILWLGLSGLMVYLLVGELLDHRSGLFTSILFLVLHGSRQDVILYIGNAALSGFLYGLLGYLLIRVMKYPTVTGVILLGITTGIANLNHAGTLLIGPLSAIIILTWLGIRSGDAWRKSLLLIATVGIMLTPWIIRNYAVFGKFVPVRSGFGYQLYIGNPGLAHTITQGHEFQVGDSASLWTAENALQALQRLRNFEYDAALADYSKRVVSGIDPVNYRSYNEVERDRVFLNHSLAFFWREPILSAKLLFWKVVTFLSFGQIMLKLVAIAAILGGLIFIKDTRVATLVLLVGAYMFPYVLTLPLYYRYRSSIEPMFFVLGGLFLSVFLRKSTMILWLLVAWIRDRSGRLLWWRMELDGNIKNENPRN